MANFIIKILKPECSRCNKKQLFGKNFVTNIQDLKRIDEYEKHFDSYKHLCEHCWEELKKGHCSLCSKEFNIFENKKGELSQNFTFVGFHEPKINRVKRICPSCYKKEKRSLCDKCSKHFFNNQDEIGKYRGSDEFRNYLYPYHTDYSDKWIALCPSCYQECLRSVEQVKEGLANWIDGTKGEFVKEHRTIKKLGKVEIKPDDRWCDEPDDVEKKLKLYSVQKGGNAFIKLFTRQMSESSRVLKGYSNNGNPFYGTAIERWFTGYAYAVLVVNPRLQEKASSYQPTTNGGKVDVKDTRLIIDGLNVCLWQSGSTKPDIRILLTLVKKLTERRHSFLCYFDANTPHRIYEEGAKDDTEIYRFLIDKYPHSFAEVPGGMRTDDFILLTANTDNAIIISNDQYRDYLDRYEWLKDQSRIVKGMVAKNRMIIPAFSIDIEVEKDSARVFQDIPWVKEAEDR